MDPTEFGDPIQFPVLESLREIIEEIKDARLKASTRRRVSNLLRDFRMGIKEIRKINSPFRKKLLHLWKEDNRKKIADSTIFSKVVKTHLDNFMVAIYRNEIKNLKN